MTTTSRAVCVNRISMMHKTGVKIRKPPKRKKEGAAQ
jgi:hypothetical protein